MSTAVLPTAAGTGPLTGTGTLLRLALRRDRLLIPLWLLGIGGLLAAGPPGLAALYSTATERAQAATSMSGNSSLRALYGPVLGDSLGALVVWRYGVVAAVLTAVLSLLLVVRHTRDEEESGRQEMLSAAVVGRRAPLTAALLTAVTANLAVALVATAALAGEGLRGALAHGLALGATGLLFAAVAATTAQLTGNARLARGLAAAVLGAAFVARAGGDAARDDGSSPLSWASPLGWAQNIRPFAGERWWVLALYAAATLALAGLAHTLAARRDLGAGLLPARPGAPEGRLATPAALAWRLQRGTLLGWTLAFAPAAVLFGSLADGAAALLGDDASTREILHRLGGEQALTDAFLAAMTGVFGLLAALYAVAAVLRLHAEETGHRAEPLLGHPVGRLRWAAGHLLTALAGPAALLATAACGLALGHGRGLPALLLACLVQLPAVWVLAAAAFTLYAVRPRAAPAGWALVTLCLLIGWVGPVLDLPARAMDLSPFTHVPKLPGPDPHWPPVAVLVAVAAGLLVLGLARLRARDLAT
ncbi:ABC transporter permease [Streptomyces diastaticus]|uniref:ABC transporter permease n=1 Tax=Streptomyces rutgersensis TaxID=53451 RepID=A0ABX6RLV3_9ACTN|nr:ABC transporter permease [Streptomyces rutgersensis]QNE81657.1 ABC transporter permease [Streptomyces rutgersensis]